MPPHVSAVAKSLLKLAYQANVLNAVDLCVEHALITAGSVMAMRALDTHRIGNV